MNLIFRLVNLFFDLFISYLPTNRKVRKSCIAGAHVYQRIFSSHPHYEDVSPPSWSIRPPSDDSISFKKFMVLDEYMKLDRFIVADDSSDGVVNVGLQFCPRQNQVKARNPPSGIRLGIDGSYDRPAGCRAIETPVQLLGHVLLNG